MYRPLLAALESACPQDGVSIGTPTPRNDSAASNRMLLGIRSVAQMVIGATRFGRISRMMMRASLSPSYRAASTNSFSRSESVVERTMRAM